MVRSARSTFGRTRASKSEAYPSAPITLTTPLPTKLQRAFRTLTHSLTHALARSLTHFTHSSLAPLAPSPADPLPTFVHTCPSHFVHSLTS
eukprot:882084-Pyramimonas_sp.AAC.1